MPLRRGVVASGVFGLLPGAPASGSAESTTTTNNGSVLYSWAAPADTGGLPITGYRVQYSTDNATWTTAFDYTTSTSSQIGNGYLTNGTLYYFRVQAKNILGYGPYSAACTATPARTPDAVQSLSLSAGDRSITPTWSAPAFDGGSAITSYTIEINLNDTGWSDLGVWTSGTAITVRNTSGDTARSYKVRVTANNRIGSYATSTSSSATPAFPAAGLPSAGMRAGYPSTGSRGTRYFNITYSPSVCNSFSSAQIWMALSGYSYQPYGDGVVMGSNSSAADQVWYLTSLYNPSFGGYRVPQPSETYYFYIRTINTDGDYIDSAINGFTTSAYQNSQDVGVYDETAGSYTTSTVAVNANTYSITAGYVANANRRTDSVRCYAWSTTGSSTICTSSRYFTIAFSNATTGTYSNESQLLSPFSTNSGQTPRSRLTAHSQGYGGATNSGRVQIRGAGSISSGWVPTISVYCVISYTDRANFQY